MTYALNTRPNAKSNINSESRFISFINLKFKDKNIEGLYQNQRYERLKFLIFSIIRLSTMGTVVGFYYYMSRTVEESSHSSVFTFKPNVIIGMVFVVISLFKLISCILLYIYKDYQRRNIFYAIISVLFILGTSIENSGVRMIFNSIDLTEKEITLVEKILQFLKMTYLIFIDNNYTFHIIAELTTICINGMWDFPNFYYRQFILAIIYFIFSVIIFYYYERLHRNNFYNKFELDAEDSMKTIFSDLAIGFVALTKDMKKLVYMNQFADYAKNIWTDKEKKDEKNPNNNNIKKSEIIGEEQIKEEDEKKLKNEYEKKLKNYVIADNLLNFIFNGNIPEDLEEVYNSDKFKLLCIKHVSYNKKDSIQLQFMMRFNKETNYIEIIFNEVSDISRLEKTKAEKWLKGVYIGKITHEFKNPLISIEELMRILQIHIDQGNTNEIKKTGRKIKAIASFLMFLIKDFGDKAKNDSFDTLSIRKTKFNLKDVIDLCVDIYETHSELNEKNIQIKAKLDPHIPNEIFSDSVRLTQVLINFMSNSFKFTTSGQILLEVSSYTIKGLGLEKNQHKLKFDITDTGMGIPIEEIEHLAEPYNKLDIHGVNNELGSGLGLYISKEIINQLGGGFCIRSKMFHGTTISFYLDFEEPIINNNNNIVNPQISNKQNILSEENQSNKNKKIIPNSSKTIQNSRGTLDNLIQYNNISNKLTQDFNKNRQDSKKDIVKVDEEINSSLTSDNKLIKSNTYMQGDNNKKNSSSVIELEDLTKVRSTTQKNLSASKILLENKDKNFFPKFLLDSKCINDLDNYNPSDGDKKKTIARSRAGSNQIEFLLENNINYSKDSFSFNFLSNVSTPYLPLNQTSISTRDCLSHKSKLQRKGTKKILIVDDEKLMRSSEIHMLTTTFEKYKVDYNIVECSDGAECLYELYVSRKKRIIYDAIFIDLSMNFINGKHLLKIFEELIEQKILAPSQIVILSSIGYEEELFKLHRNIISCYLAKPIDTNDLVRFFDLSNKNKK